MAESSDGSVTTNSSKLEENRPEIVELEILSNSSSPEKETKSNFNELNLPETGMDIFSSDFEIKSVTLPQIDKTANGKVKYKESNANSLVARSHTSLNIFDQTTSSVLNLFSSRNWTETFLNRIFRKKILTMPTHVRNPSSLPELQQATALIRSNMDIDKIDSYLMTSRKLPSMQTTQQIHTNNESVNGWSSS